MALYRAFSVGIYDYMNKVHYSSKSDDWETPQDFFDEIQKEFKLNLDVCADFGNTKLKSFITKEADGLQVSWKNKKCWMNPPYGREITKWVKKAHEGGARIVVALLPARTDTRWFHDYILNKAEIRFIKGRLKFGGHKNPAPFPSMVVIWQ